MLALFLCREFLLHIPCWLHFYLGGFSYTSRAGFTFIWGVSLTYPMLVAFLCGEFLLHIPWWLHFYTGNFSFTSRAGFIFMQGVFLAHPTLAYFVNWGVSLRHPVLVSFFSFFLFFSFLSGEFLLHILCWICFDMGRFSYTSHAALNFVQGVRLTHFVLLHYYAGYFSLPSFLCGEVLLQSRAGLFWCEELLSSVVYSEVSPLRKELGGSWPRRKVWKNRTLTRLGSPRTAWTEQKEKERKKERKKKNGVKSGHRN